MRIEHVGRPTMYVMVGLPGAGKTTHARQLEAERLAVRLTPDEWMIPLFGESDPDGKRDVLEGRLVWLALRVLRAGASVVLDFGVWGRDERWALRSLSAAVGADCRLVYLAVDKAEQQRRIAARLASDPTSTFSSTAADLEAWRRLFQAPDDLELAMTDLPSPPPRYPTWAAWADERWPTSMS